MQSYIEFPHCKMINECIIKERIKIFIIAIFAILICLEINLRIIGLIYSNGMYLNKKSLINKQNTVYTILFLGDSFTFGLGAPLTENMPSHLQNLLDVRFNEKPIRIINKGVPAYNSTQVLEKLRYAINSIKPNTIILLIGQSNEWNYYGFHSFLKKENIFLALLDWLYRIRIFKLIKLLFISLNHKVKNNQPIKAEMATFKIEEELENLSHPVNTKILRDSIKKGQKNLPASYKLRPLKKSPTVLMTEILKYDYNDPPSNFNLCHLVLNLRNQRLLGFCNSLKLGFSYMRIGNYDEAIKWFKEGITADPTNSYSYNWIGRAYLNKKDYDEAIKWFKEGIKADPTHLINYNHIVQTYKLAHMDNKEIINFLQKASKNNPAVQDYIELLKINNIESEITNWVRYDINKIAAFCKKRNIEIILQTYPFDTTANKIIKEIAEMNSMPLVDNYIIFNELPNKEDYFSSDGHCNSKGYKVMAMNIYNTFIINKLGDIENDGE